MIVSKQIWQCITGGRQRVYGIGAVSEPETTPLIYCAEHARLCAHKYLENQDQEYIDFLQGTNVVDTAK